MATKDYTLVGIYWDNHHPFVTHVQAETPAGAEAAFQDPRHDEVAYEVLAVLDGAHHDARRSETALANAAASFRAICEYLDGACAHTHGEGRDCYVCDAYNSAQRGQLAAAAAIAGKE